MNVKQILDRTLAFDGILSGDSQYTTRRATHLEWLQEIVETFCMMRPFAWRLKSTTINITAPNMTAQLPSDFVEFGAVGSVLDNNRKHYLEEKSPIIIQRLQVMPAQTIHHEFAVFSKTPGANPSPPGPLLFQIGANGASQAFTAWYLPLPPTLQDLNQDNSGVDVIPLGYHFSILLPKMKAKIQYANDGMRDFWEREAQKGIDNAIKTDGQGRNSSILRSPSSTPGMW